MGDTSRASDPGLVVGVTVGISAYTLLRGQLAWFADRGWDVTLVSTPDEQAHRAATREGVPLAGIPMHRGISPLRDLVSLVQWVRLLARKRPRAVNLGTPKAALLGAVASWLLRIPKRLYVVRGLRLEGSAGILGRVLWAMEWITMRLATDVLFVGPSLAAEGERRGLLMRHKSWLIGSGSSNGVDAAAVVERAGTVDRDALRHRLGLESDHFVVGFIGRITRDKGVDTLLKACSSADLAPHVRLLLIGTVDEPDLEHEIVRLGDLVRTVPWTDDVWGHLPAMDALCLPTLREGFPNVVLEAAAAGIPTITTRATGAVDSVVDGRTGMLIDVGDAPDLTSKVNDLAGSPELTARLGAAAKERVFAEFTPERIWQGLHEIIDDAAEPVDAVRVDERPSLSRNH
ncbi:glycosyltransferase family 4 protein [Propionibacteriaceae bacterium Y2011]